MTVLYTISPLSEENAREITTWRYEVPFDLYDLRMDNLSGFVNPEYRYYQVQDRRGNLVGYCCFGLDAQVPGGDYRLSEPHVLDVGVGLRPDLVGQGRGADFIGVILNFAETRYQPDNFRVTIADFNQRSQKTFQKHGFVESHKFIRELVELPFTQFEKENK